MSGALNVAMIMYWLFLMVIRGISQYRSVQNVTGKCSESLKR